MKITVLGGAGVFGSRLAEMLIRDGHQVTIAGRTSASVTQAAARLGATALILDRRGDLAALRGADVVIDAAGPFHAYGADPCRLARYCVGAGMHYLDLAGDARFCAGITTLDSAARAAGVFVLSGVSSVPGLSYAVVAALAEGLDSVEMIDCAILPGNRAPRGRSVVESILHQTGAGFALTIDGQAVTRRSWSDPQSYALAPEIERRAYAIEVPDQTLFPAYFGARTVVFRAGLELWVTLSHLRATPQGMSERFGPMTFLLGLAVTNGALHFPVRAGRFLGLPMPPFLCPQSIAREYEAEGRFWFDVELRAPLTGRMTVHYRGCLARAG